MRKKTTCIAAVIISLSMLISAFPLLNLHTAATPENNTYNFVKDGALNTDDFSFDPVEHWQVPGHATDCAMTGGQNIAVEFAFTGTGFSIDASVNIQNGGADFYTNDNVLVSIDGGTAQPFDFGTADYIGIKTVFSINGLIDGLHTVRIVNGQSLIGALSEQVYLKSVTIVGGEIGVLPNWSSLIPAVQQQKMNQNFTYESDNWIVLNDAVRANTLDDSMSFTIMGTGLRVYAMVNVQGDTVFNNDVVTISIDGGDPQRMEMLQLVAGQSVIVFETTDLEPDVEHTIQIVNGARERGANHEFYFCGIQICNGYMIDPRGSVTSLELVSLPTAIHYGDNDRLDLTGAVLMANDDPEYLITLSDSDILYESGYVLKDNVYCLDKTKIDQVQEIVCSYNGVEFTYPAVYYSVRNIEIGTLPKTEYRPTDPGFTTGGGTITLYLGAEDFDLKTQVIERLTVPMITTQYGDAYKRGDVVTVECSYYGIDFAYDINFVSILGDVNGDGVVDEKDVALLLQYVAQVEDVALDDEALTAGNVDGYAGITIADVTVLRSHVELETPLELSDGVNPVTVEPTQAELTPNANGVIAITQNNVRHIGRTYYDTQKEGYRFNWSASGFEIRFEGTKLEMELQSMWQNLPANSECADPFVLVFIDGHEQELPLGVSSTQYTKRIQLSGAKTWYTLAEGLDNGVHTVKIIKQNEAPYSSAIATGLRVTGTLLAPPAAKQFGILAIGDSISAGVANLIPLGTWAEPTYRADEEDAWQTTAAYLSRSLNADLMIHAGSGAALYKSAGPVHEAQMNATVLEQFVQYDPYWGYKAGLTADHQRVDLIILNLGTNDADALRNDADKQAFTDTYIEFLRYLRNRYPEAMILCTGNVIRLDPFDTLVQQAVQTVVELDGDYNLFAYQESNVLVMNETSIPHHPRTENNAILAQEMETIVREKLSWLP